MNYKKMSYISGAAIFTGLVIILIAIMWLSQGNIFLSKNYSVFARFKEITGIRDQSPVFFRGYRVGAVKEVAFQKDGILLELNIKKRYAIPTGSEYVVGTLNFIGEKAIFISPLEAASTFVQSGDTVNGENRDMMAMLQGLLTGLQKNVDNGEITGRFARLGESIDLMQSILHKLDVKLDQVDAAAFNRELAEIGAIGDEIREFLAASRPGVQNLTEEGQNALVKVNETCDRISRLTQSVQSVSDKIDHGDGTAAELVNNRETIENLNAMMTEMKRLIEDLRANPQRYVKLSIF